MRAEEFDFHSDSDWLFLIIVLATCNGAVHIAQFIAAKLKHA